MLKCEEHIDMQITGHDPHSYKTIQYTSGLGFVHRIVTSSTKLLLVLKLLDKFTTGYSINRLIPRSYCLS